MSDVRVQVSWVNQVLDRYLIVSGDNEREIGVIRARVIGIMTQLQNQLSSVHISDEFVQYGRPTYAMFTLQLFGQRATLEEVILQCNKLIRDRSRPQV
jgi:hypothetical protein